MINLVQLKASITQSIDVLKTLDLYKGIGFKPTGNHSSESKKVAKNNRHTDIYNTAIANLDYEIILNDDSIFQFSSDQGLLRYAFIQNPRLFVEKVNYLASLYGNEELAMLTDLELKNLEESIKDEEYEQFLNEQDINTESQIIRYDLDVNGYHPLIHSYSHIHVGLNGNFRLPCSKVISPLKFVLFSVKHTYYKQWRNAIIGVDNFAERVRDSKARCENLPREYWHDTEIFELYLS